MKQQETNLTVNSELLSAELTRFRELRHRLMEAGDTLDDAIVLDVLAGVGDLHDAILTEVRSALEDEDAASRLRGRMDEMEARLRRIERRAEGKRDVALNAMAEAGLDHLEAPGLRIEVRRAPGLLVVSDESLIPAAFKVQRPAWLDYQAIRDAIKGGAEVPGASLQDTEPYLSVRTS
jgi:hypothetical protein